MSTLVGLAATGGPGLELLVMMLLVVVDSWIIVDFDELVPVDP